MGTLQTNVRLESAKDAFARISERGTLVEFGDVPAYDGSGHVQGIVPYGEQWIVSQSRRSHFHDSGWLILLDAREGTYRHRISTPPGLGNHPGGMQVCGDYLFVAVEGFEPRTDAGGAIVIYDLSKIVGGRLPPAPIATVPVNRPGLPGPTLHAGCVAVTDVDVEVPRVTPGPPEKRRAHLAAVHHAGTLRFFRSMSTSLDAPRFDHFATVAAPHTAGFDQMALIVDRDGLCLVTLEHESDVHDWASLWRVDLRHDGVHGFTRLGRRRFVTTHGAAGPGVGVHFVYGGGARVVSATTLHLYAAQPYLTAGNRFATNVFGAGSAEGPVPGSGGPGDRRTGPPGRGAFPRHRES